MIVLGLSGKYAGGELSPSPAGLAPAPGHDWPRWPVIPGFRLTTFGGTQGGKSTLAAA